jgi:hypothetical protein
MPFPGGFMGIQGWKKIIAIFLVITFIGIGLTWAMEQGSLQFQEKEGTPIIKKHKKFPWLIVILGVAALGVGIYFLTKKKSEDRVDYTVTLQGRNVENIDEVVSGNISFKLDNGTVVSGSNSSSLVLEGSNRIVDASVSGQGNYFPNDLIFKDADTGEVLGKKDAKGFSSFAVKDGQKMRVDYIKQGFDIELFKRCLSLDVTPVVKRYDKSVVNVGIMNGGIEPSATDIKNLTDFIDKYNTILDGKMRLNYVGKVTTALTDGITYGIANTAPSHYETVVSDVITKSNFVTKSNVELAFVLEEGDGAASARGDGGFAKTPYVDIATNDFNAEGERVIHLQYCLPVGYAPNGSTVSTPLSSIGFPNPTYANAKTGIK